MHQSLPPYQPIGRRTRHIGLSLFMVATIALCWLQPGNVRAQGNSPHTSQGKLLYNAQEYDKAIVSFRKALEDKSSNDNDRVTALEHLGLIAVILNKKPAARRYFLRLLTLSPQFTLDSSHSPKLVKAFSEVKREFDAKRKVTLENVSPTELPSEQALELRIKVTDHFKQVKQATLWYRIEGTSRFIRRTFQEVSNPGWQSRAFRFDGERMVLCATATKAPAARSTTSLGTRYFSYTIPKFVGRTEGYYIQYYVEVSDGTKNVLATLGSAKSPQSVKRTVKAQKALPPPSTPIYKKWWLWTIVGVGVAGGVVAIVVATLPKAPPTPDTGTAVITIIKPTY